MKIIIQTEVMTFDELSDEAKEKARSWYLEACGRDDGQFAWEHIQEDAKNIGLRIDSINDHKANKGSFVESAPACAEKIIKEHGESCETYKTAKKYLANWQKVMDCENDEADTLDDNFLQAILEDYRIMLNKEYEFLQSNESVDENIRINEYTFTADGKRFG